MAHARPQRRSRGQQDEPAAGKSGQTRSRSSALAGWALSLFGKSPAKPTTNDLDNAEFGASTQRLGVRLTERIRDVFRFRWLKRTRGG